MDYQQYIYYFDEMNRVNVKVFCTVAGRPRWCLQEPKSSNQKFCRSVDSTARLLRATEGTRQHQHVLLFVFSSLGRNRSVASGCSMEKELRLSEIILPLVTADVLSPTLLFGSRPTRSCYTRTLKTGNIQRMGWLLLPSLTSRSIRDQFTIL